MRMSPCPECLGHNVNTYKKGNHWGAKCYNKECGFYIESASFEKRGQARKAWNENALGFDVDMPTLTQEEAIKLINQRKQ